MGLSCKSFSRSFIKFVASRPAQLPQKRFYCSNKSRKSLAQSGFTLLESLVVVILLGILAGIATPSWIAFWNDQKIATAQGQVVEILHSAQESAKQRKLSRQASFRTQNGRVQWAIHAIGADLSSLPWQSLEAGIQLDSESTFPLTNTVYRVQFNQKGEVNGQLGRLTLSISSSPMTKRCVFVSTLLGAIRVGETRSRPDNGKFCY